MDGCLIPVATRSDLLGEGQPTPSPDPPTKARRAALALIVAMVALAVWHQIVAWQAADAAAERMAMALARTMEYQSEVSFRGIDGLLMEAAQRIDPAKWPEPALSQWFASRLAAFPEATNMVVTGTDGRSQGTGLSADGPVGGRVDLSDRVYFQAQRDRPTPARMVIGDPVTGRINGRPSIPLSRAIIDSGGNFRGIVAVGIDPSYLVGALERLLIEDAGGISLIRDDGIFLARLPDQHGSFGRSTAASPLFREFIPRAKTGIARFVSVTDGNAKIVAYRTLAHYPLVATVGITENTAFAAFRAETAWVILVVTGLAAALYRLATMSDFREHSCARLARRLEAQSHHLEDQVVERTRHLAQAQAEAELRARQLAASNADLEQFAYIASHDLQEPLRTVTSFVQLLQHRYRDKLGAEADDYIGFVVDGTRRMHELIVDLLAYARVSTQGAPLARAEVRDAVAEAMSNLVRGIDESGTVVHVHSLPCLDIDRHQIASLFQNLIGNAIKYRSPDRTPTIDIAARPQGDEWVFTVTDNGIGIDPQYAERIFEIFQRLHGTGSGYEGTGIGLSICKRIAERHGGRIWVVSVPGEGSTFTFTLPATPPADDYTAISAAATERPSINSTL